MTVSAIAAEHACVEPNREQRRQEQQDRRRRLAIADLALAALATAACGIDRVDTCAVADLTPPPRTEAEVRPILARSCALGGCHLHAPGAGGLVLGVSSSAWVDAVVGVASQQNPERDLVVSGDAGESWLVRKIDGELCGARCAGGCGGRMPVGAPLSVEERDVIVGWIAAGAPRGP